LPSKKGNTLLTVVEPTATAKVQYYRG